jgi:uncharacterized protein (DUF4213/DUF364 family)
MMLEKPLVKRRKKMTLTVQKRLLDYVKPRAGGAVVTDVRIGLGYTAVLLESGHAGVAWTPKSDAPCCTHFQAAGTLAGRTAEELLAFLVDEKSGLARAVGLATANALLAALPHPQTSREEVISTLNITPEDKVAMVGYFGPIVAELRKIGCRLDIIELNPHHGETITPEQGAHALATCSVAILTGTSMINGTCDELLAELGNPRAAVLLGPSSPLCSAIFEGTGITHVAGSRVREADAVLRIVSEGGGTMLMKKYLDFETVQVD